MSESIEAKEKVIGVLTSGGDSQGMNAAIVGIVRFGLFKKFKVYLIYEGYNGLIKGEDNVKEALLSSVDHISHRGGTFIGSSRCKEFFNLEGRVTAALTLIKRNISNLIVIGGDGSLTGANILKNEWNTILETLLKSGQITEQMKNKNSYLNIAGIVGSIDNDFCKTDITTGADTALHRIIESVDSITTTATSHKRVMVVEVMGRHCGYLALVSALATEATYAFIPESPPPENWPQILRETIDYEREKSRRLNIIIVSEGALDLNGNPITSEDVKKAVAKTQFDVRITILGHIQRGGQTSAYDMILGSRLGKKAVEFLEESNENSKSIVLTVEGNKITEKPLLECVEQTKELNEAMKNKDWKKCFDLRGKAFQRNFETFCKIISKSSDGIKSGKNFGVIQVGEPSPGMNAAVLSFTRLLLIEEQTVIGVKDGIEGLISGKLSNIEWKDVNGWTRESGSLLGSSSRHPRKIKIKEFEAMAQQIDKNKIKGMLIIGGFKAFVFIQHLLKYRKKFNAFRIAICLIPSTIDNNIPGTELSLGADSTINKISGLCTDIIMSTRGTRGRVYIIHMISSYCGYLSVMSAIASDADYCYIFEKEFTENDIKRDAQNIKQKMIADNRNRLIIVNEFVNNNLNKSVENIYSEEGKGVFKVISVDVSFLMQSSSPSPFDRIFGIKLGLKTAFWLKKNISLEESFNTVVIGLDKQKYSFSRFEELIPNTDFKHEMPKNQWFVHLVDYINLCS